jgi:hypothetical protein
MNHPLDEAFGFSDIQDMPEINIENPDLDLIINLALSAYKQNYEIIGLIEPKNRLKFLEICERFLGQAKDALYKKQQLQIQAAKIQKPKVVGTAEVLLEDKKEDAMLISRDSLYA